VIWHSNERLHRAAEDAKRLLHEEVFQLLSRDSGTRAKGPSALVLMYLRKRKPELMNRKQVRKQDIARW